MCALTETPLRATSGQVEYYSLHSTEALTFDTFYVATLRFFRFSFIF